jgi:formylglycine-generating enzyme required for sulfatase activity
VVERGGAPAKKAVELFLRRFEQHPLGNPLRSEAQGALDAIAAAEEAARLTEAEKEQARMRASLEREAAARAERTEIQWVRIPAGSFQMGSQDGESDEKPVHTVTLRAFLMSKTEVTVGQYRKCVEAGVCTQPQWESCYLWDGSKWNLGVAPQSLRGDQQPVVCVDWGQARTFAKWVGADLPTEAEWEYAARGGQSFTYAGSNSPDDVAWYASNSGGGTKAVGTKQANAFGLHDMSGNVWEWTLDEYKSDYTGAPSDGQQAVGSLPTCSTKCDNGAAGRVNRGGSWSDVASNLRVAYRFSVSPVLRLGVLGLRLRRTLP